METLGNYVLTYLLNAVWQVALVAAAAAGCMSLLRHAPARHRHVLWVAALVVSFALPLWSLQQPPKGAVKHEPAAAPLLAEVETGAAPAPAEGPWIAYLLESSGQTITLDFPLMATVAGLYFLFIVYRLTRLWRTWEASNRIRRAARRRAVPEPIQRVLDRCQRMLALRLGRDPLLFSPNMDGPLTAGVRCPSIILPEHLLEETSPELLTAAIGHELAHIRRRDFALNLVYELLYLPISFHPAAALVKRRINQTRELACDEAVTEHLMDARSYARSLVNFASSSPYLGRHSYTLGVTDANILEERVMKLLKSSPRVSARLAVLSLAAASLILTAVAVGAAKYSFTIEPAVAAQDAGNLFIGTWKGTRESSSKAGASRTSHGAAEYVVTVAQAGNKLDVTVNDVGSRIEFDANGKAKAPKKVRDAKVKVNNVKLSGSTLTFQVKDGAGKATDVSMKLVSDNEALVEFVGEMRDPGKSAARDPFSIRLRRQ
ncbi:MAG TPA: M56 family metallopeptidase [Pyrinomonadaceae bacterium]|nr:M56 family metallopeptidase [Pyrinomonadaceae bacterium]